jgi:hypothetical protein
MKNLLTFAEFINESILNEKASLEPNQLDIAKQVSKITKDFLGKDLKRIFSKYGIQTAPSYESVQLYNSKGQALFCIEYSPMMGYSKLIKIRKVIVKEHQNYGTLAPNLNRSKEPRLDITDVRNAMTFWYNDFGLEMRKGSVNSKPAADENSPLLKPSGIDWSMFANNPERASILTDEYVKQYETLISNLIDGIESNLESLEKVNLL